jgi:N-acetylmuramoyl-L-alanine amidase
MHIIDYPSPNFDERPPGTRIKYLIYHYTEGNLEESLEWLTKTNPTGGKVSAHYLISEEGQVYSLVPENKRAWHAGISAWENDVGLNNNSIGIELVNSGDKSFSSAQMTALAILSKDIVARHAILPFYILGHSDIAPDRKLDPGMYFDWKWLASKGIGLYPAGDLLIQTYSTCDLQQKLKEYGYQLDVTGFLNPQTESVLRAFQLHFGQGDYTSISTKLDILLDLKAIDVPQRTVSLD